MRPKWDAPVLHHAHLALLREALGDEADALLAADLPPSPGGGGGGGRDEEPRPWALYASRSRWTSHLDGDG